MTRTWQTWLLYGLCVAVVVPAMIWLTITTSRLDRAREVDRQETEVARREAEMLERMSSALWRMDWLLIPLVAQEAARPAYMYQAFYESPSTPPPSESPQWIGGQLRPSPILVQPSNLIRLHFQLDNANQIRSPQDPQGNDRQLAEIGCQINPTVLEENNALLFSCQETLSFQKLERFCSRETLPAVDAEEFPVWQKELLASQLASNDFKSDNRFIDSLPAAETLEAAPAGEDPNEPLLQKQQRRTAERNRGELMQRSKAAQAYAYGQQMQNAVVPGPLTPLTRVGAMRPVWIDDKLLLIRQVVRDQEKLIQGCWLDWEKIRAALTEEVGDLFPEFELKPLPPDAPAGWSRQRLATLPIELVVDTPKFLASLSLDTAATPRRSISGLRLSLLVAWVGLISGLLAIALLLGGVLRLSERRNDFVSAVTHELRTPLTTFRMYAEMLAEGMIPDPEQQRQYAQTMKVEADRLGHLVENVLQFARLEHRPGQRCAIDIPVVELLQRCRLRLAERAVQANLEIHESLSAESKSARVRTSPESIEQILFNLVENACKYARPATLPRIDLSAAVNGPWVEIRVRDYGPGIPPQQRRNLFRPFTKSDQDAANSAPGVGLGLALCQRMARDLGGALALDAPNTQTGATFLLRLPLASPIET